LFTEKESFVDVHFVNCRRGSRGGGGRTRHVPPLKLEKIWFFWVFTQNTPKIFAPPSARCNFFKSASPNLKSWIRPWTEQSIFKLFSGSLTPSQASFYSIILTKYSFSMNELYTCSWFSWILPNIKQKCSFITCKK
jgi:hypothetical protein